MEACETGGLSTGRWCASIGSSLKWLSVEGGV